MKNKRPILNSILFFTAVLIILPIILIVVWMVSTRWPWPGLVPGGLSARGIHELFAGHSQAFRVMLSSLGFSLLTALAATVIGFMSGRAFAAYAFKGKGLLRFLSLLPVIIPANVFAMGIHVIFIRLGLADNAAGVMACHVIYALPYTINIMTEVISGLGNKYEEQSYVLGGNKFKTFITVSLPLLLPAFFSSISMAYIISFSQYFLTLLIGGGMVKTFSVIMTPFITGGDRTIASSYVVLFLISSAAVFAFFELVAKTFVKRRKG